MQGVAGTPEFSVPIRLKEREGLARRRVPVRFGVPLPRAHVFRSTDVELRDGRGGGVEHQARVLAYWPDQSAKWLLVDALADVDAHSDATYCLGPSSAGRTTTAATLLQPMYSDDSWRVRTGIAQFDASCRGPKLLTSIKLADRELLGSEGMQAVLRLRGGHLAFAFTDTLDIEEQGPVRVGLLAAGGFALEGRPIGLRWRCRLAFFSGSGAMRAEFVLHNPRAAQHAGGLWDLGDAGSFLFEDLSLTLWAAAQPTVLAWHAEDPSDGQRGSHGHLSIYQDSSGGENWRSSNHVDAAGQSTVSFQGYCIRAGAIGAPEVIGRGKRATPVLGMATEAGWLACAMQDFWQNFPKALRAEGARLEIALFPKECTAEFEIQGGEQKRHVFWLEVGQTDRDGTLPSLVRPLTPAVDPVWTETTGAIAYCIAAEHDPNRNCRNYVNSIIEGPHSFVGKRERVDEYGWRHFGDVYADHEAVHSDDSMPLISHYNNQYDFVHGALVQFMRTGDPRWFELMREAAQHVIDIDIYHTSADRSAYNGGFFWHTDHYLDAATCSHRTYSRRNAQGGSYGGGPSNEHNYTSGLLHYYFLTGDVEAAACVESLGDWVIAMDEGANTLLGLLDSSPTGLASKTTSADYHGPGRGAGNSINALLDAYVLTGKRGYAAKIEELIQRCINPADEIGARRLDDPEHRWSYLVFLQVLGRFLEFKGEWAEYDYIFHYARESLLHYGQWMMEHEVPYKEVLHKVLLPTETWPAHDIRKCHILHLAARYDAGKSRDAYRERAGYFFQRCLNDLLGFETAYLTRPQVILCVYGHVQAHFQRYGEAVAPERRHSYRFGAPRVFEPQSVRARREWARKLRAAVGELCRIGLDRLANLRRRASPRP